MIVDELFTIHGLTIAEMLKKKYGTPYIIYSPTHHTSFSNDLMALGRNYGAHMSLFTNIPESYEDRYQPAKFSERMFSVFEGTSETVAINQFIPFIMKSPKLLNFNKEFSFTDSISNAWLYMSEHFDKIGQIMPCMLSNHLIALSLNFQILRTLLELGHIAKVLLKS